MKHFPTPSTHAGIHRRLPRALFLSSTFLLAFAVSLAAGKAQSAEQAFDQCDSCGPAPCCVVLWITWCGCPFAE